MNIFQLIGIGLGGAVIALTVKQINPQFALYTSMATAIILSGCAFGFFSPIVEYAQELSSGLGTDAFTSAILRVTAIGAISKLASEICFDAGESAIGGRIELLGKGAIAVSILPVLKSLIKTAESFLM